LYLYSC